jgi:LPXTG-motif cell wall-anchored protein
MLKARSAVAVLALAMLMTVAIGGPASAAGVSIVDFSFQPATVTIDTGDSVTWTNNGDAPHTTTSDSGVWDSDILDPGQSFTRVFDTAGTFPYHCNVHPSMTGTVVVQAGGGGGGGTTLPSTGAGDSTIPFVWVGLLFVLAGGAVLLGLRMRRRRA